MMKRPQFVVAAKNIWWWRDTDDTVIGREISEIYEKTFERLEKNVFTNITTILDLSGFKVIPSLLKEGICAFAQQWRYFKSVGKEEQFFNSLKNVDVKLHSYVTSKTQQNLFSLLMKNLYSKNSYTNGSEHKDNCKYAREHCSEFIKTLYKHKLISKTYYDRIIKNKEPSYNYNKTNIFKELDKLVTSIAFPKKNRETSIEVAMKMKKIVSLMNSEQFLSVKKSHINSIKTAYLLGIFIPFLSKENAKKVLEIINMAGEKSKKTAISNLKSIIGDLAHAKIYKRIIENKSLLSRFLNINSDTLRLFDEIDKIEYILPLFSASITLNIFQRSIQEFITLTYEEKLFIFNLIISMAQYQIPFINRQLSIGTSTLDITRTFDFEDFKSHLNDKNTLIYRAIFDLIDVAQPHLKDVNE